MKKLVTLCLALLAVPAFAAEVGHEVVPGQIDPLQRAADMDALHGWLVAHEAGQAPTPLRVEIAESELARLKAAPTNTGRLLAGVNQAVGVDVVIGARNGFGRVDYDRDLTLWTAAIESPGATAVRLHLTDFFLPEGASLYVYNARGEAFGPYTGKGLMSNGEQWTHSVTGPEIRLQLHLEGEALASRDLGSLFTVEQVGHLGENYLFAQALDPSRAFCSFNESCVQNAACNSIPSAIQPYEDAAAHLLFAVGSSQYICSGGLINDTDSATQRPLLLTANHCISSGSSASSLEAYFQFTTSCGGTCYNPYSASLPRTVGSSILATGTSGDYSLLELSQPAPSGTVLLGWTTSAVANSSGASLYRISHPKGAPQAYSEHSVNTTAGTCGTLPRGTFIYSDDTLGATEGGSSGSPVLNSSGQIVGQLYGACGLSPSTPCDGDDRTVDGALAAYYSNVEPYLDPSGGPGGGGNCTGNNVWTGTASSSSGDQVTPNCSASGTFDGELACGNGAADLDLHLDKESCSWWSCSFSAVASSTSGNCDEQITYSGSSGTYRWRVTHYSGPAEPFELCTNQC